MPSVILILYNNVPYLINVVQYLREYTREVQQRLVKFLKPCPVSPQHAQEFLLMLLDEYQALCTASDFLYPYFAKLVGFSRLFLK